MDVRELLPQHTGDDSPTFVYTGDIAAMWLRDSGAQVWPYVQFANDDPELAKLIRGVILRQFKSINIDPYANAFYQDATKVGEWKNDQTDMKPGIHERKYEIDSECYPIRLAYEYWKVTGDTTASWFSASNSINRALATITSSVTPTASLILWAGMARGTP